MFQKGFQRGWFLLCIANIFFCFSAQAATQAKPNVILITFDGVRRIDFLNRQSMPIFWKKHVLEGVSMNAMVANPHKISLPGYQNLLSGFVQPCSSNDCDRVSVETLPERILRELKLKKRQVAGIASWEKIPLAFESHAGVVFTNAGFAKPNAADFGPMGKDVGESQTSDVPNWEENRYDKYTWRLAMKYLQMHRPRFLYISLNDTDDWAHQGHYPEYMAALNRYDQWLDGLFVMLRSMGEYGKNTTVILTTDHGRGHDDVRVSEGWRHHNDKTPGSEEIWFYARGPRTAHQGYVQYHQGEHMVTHSDIRPTVEKLMGLTPIECATCGHPIERVFRHDIRIENQKSLRAHL